MASVCDRLAPHSLPVGSVDSLSIQTIRHVTTLPLLQAVFGKLLITASHGLRSSIVKVHIQSAQSHSIQRIHLLCGLAPERTTASGVFRVGDGVYRSDDGGKTWREVWLQSPEHIGRLSIESKVSEIVYVAAQGAVWGPGGDRGLFKTTDGGKTWKNILNISENTGLNHVVIDSQEPKTMYAAAYQRRRHMWTLINGGPESALY